MLTIVKSVIPKTELFNFLGFFNLINKSNVYAFDMCNQALLILTDKVYGWHETLQVTGILHW